MKRITLLLVLTTLFLNAHSQLVFVYGDKELASGSSIVEKEVDDMGTIHSHVYVKNKGTAGVQATLELTVLEEPTGAMGIGYCGWGTDICQFAMLGSPISRTTTLIAGQTLNPAIEAMGVDPENTLIKGQYKLSYGDQELTVNVTFAAGAASVSSVKTTKNVNVYRNDGVTELTYRFDSQASRQVALFDLAGKVVSRRELGGNMGTVSFPELSKGIYFYSIIENGETIQTNKIAVH